MPMPTIRKTTEELIAEEEKKVEQLKARMAELKARQHAEERKRDNHRKIVVGAVSYTHLLHTLEYDNYCCNARSFVRNGN